MLYQCLTLELPRCFLPELLEHSIIQYISSWKNNECGFLRFAVDQRSYRKQAEKFHWTILEELGQNLQVPQKQTVPKTLNEDNFLGIHNANPCDRRPIALFYSNGLHLLMCSTGGC